MKSRSLQVVLLFPYIFWDDSKDMFGRVADEPAARGEFYLFYSYAHVSGGALLAALVAGSAAVALEREEPQAAVGRAMDALRRIFEPRGVEVPAPVQVCCGHYD